MLEQIKTNIRTFLHNVKEKLEAPEKYRELLLDHEKLKEEYFEQQDMITTLQEELQEEPAPCQKCQDPRTTLQAMIASGVDWYDYMDLKPPEFRKYQEHTKLLRMNPVFKNEINFLIANAGKKALVKSEDMRDVRDQRILAIAMGSLRDRVNEIPTEKQKVEASDNPYEAV